MRLKEEYRIETNIKKSTFIACAMPCLEESECRTYIEAIRKEYSDASHVCTAYVCGPQDSIQHSSDNHEPSGTAGIPMLEAIKHSGISSVCVCVVRYFGGIKLGPGGLIRAYSGAVTEVLEHAPKVEDVAFQKYSITYPYDLSGILEGWLRRNTEIVDLQYGEQVTAIIETQREDLCQQVNDLSRGTIKAKDLGIVYRQVDC